jgi:hypothetical protein
MNFSVRRRRKSDCSLRHEETPFTYLLNDSGILCLLFSHLCNMTEPKIAGLLENFGIVISSGQISAWLTDPYSGIQEEKRAIVEAGLASSPWHHMDDTGTRVNGENHHCQILCNPLYGAYFTTARKDRLTILDVLRNGRPRVFRIHEEALDLLLRFSVSQRVIEQVRQLPFHRDWSQEELQRQLAERVPDLSEGTRRPIREAAALAALSRRERARAPLRGAGRIIWTNYRTES